MTDKLWFILRAQLTNRFAESARKNGSKKGGIAAVIVMGLAFSVIAIYCFLIGMGLCLAGLASAVPVLAVIIVSLMILMFTVLKTNGMVFGCRDNEMLLSLPISHGTIAASRFVGLYLSNILTSAFAMIPLGISLVVFASPSWYFYPIWILGIFFVPIIPSAVGCVLGSFLTAVSTRFRHSNIMSSVLVMAFLIAMVVLPYMFTGSSEQDVLNMLSAMAGLFESFAICYPIAGWFGAAIIGGGVLSFLLFAGVSALVFALVVLLLSRFYFSLDSAIVGKAAGRKYSLTQQHSSSAVLSIAKKEWARFIGTPIYFTNTGVGAIMTLVICGYMSFAGLDKIGEFGLPQGLMNALALVIPIFLGMSSTSCVSLSLEGKNLWILQSAPLSTADIMGGKILMALSLTVPVSIVSSVLFVPYVNGALNIILLFLYPLVFAIFSAVFGAFVNMKLPNFKWETEVRIVKQSASAVVGMFGSMLVAIVPAILCLVFALPTNLVLLGSTAVLLTVTAVLYSWIKKTPLLFEQ